MLETIALIDSLAGGEWLLIGLLVLAGIAVAIVAVRFAVKLAIRAGIVAAVLLAGLYAAGVVG